MPEVKKCPCCDSTEIEVAGNKVHCRGCDVTFTLTEQGAKVKDLDPLGKDRERINKIEQDVEELKNRETDTEAEDDDVEEEPEGFITLIDEGSGGED